MKSTKSAVDLLVTVGSFASLPRVVVEEVAKCSTVRNLNAGQLLYSEGSEATCTYIVAQGSVKSIRVDQDGREQILSVERAGCVLGSAAIFTEGCHVSNIVANEPATVLCIETQAMKRLCRTYPQLLWEMAVTLAVRVRAYTDLAAMLSLRNVDQKLANYLVTIAQDRGVQADEGCVFELTATRMEIANRLGSVREVVSRSMAHLQERGLIAARGRLVTVPNIVALRRFALGEKTLQAPFGC